MPDAEASRKRQISGRRFPVAATAPGCGRGHLNASSKRKPRHRRGESLKRAGSCRLSTSSYCRRLPAVLALIVRNAICACEIRSFVNPVASAWSSPARFFGARQTYLHRRIVRLLGFPLPPGEIANVYPVAEPMVPLRYTIAGIGGECRRTGGSIRSRSERCRSRNRVAWRLTRRSPRQIELIENQLMKQHLTGKA